MLAIIAMAGNLARGGQIKAEFDKDTDGIAQCGSDGYAAPSIRQQGARQVLDL